MPHETGARQTCAISQTWDYSLLMFTASYPNVKRAPLAKAHQVIVEVSKRPAQGRRACFGLLDAESRLLPLRTRYRHGHLRTATLLNLKYGTAFGIF